MPDGAQMGQVGSPSTHGMSPAISADSHLIEPPHIWADWLPRHFQEHAPRLADVGSGGREWQFDSGYGPMAIDLVPSVEAASSELHIRGVVKAEVVAGLQDGCRRSLAQDCDGISGEVIFPNGSTMGHFLDHPDPDVVEAGVRAYNSYIVSEYCAADPLRLFPVAQIPSTGVDASLRELSFAIENKFVAVVLPCWPTGGEHLSDDDLIFFRMAEDARIPVCLHVRFRSRDERMLLRELRGRRRERREDGEKVLQRVSINPGEAIGQASSVLAEMLLSGLCEVCPELRLGMIETWAGWIPRLLEAIDDVFRRNARGAEVSRELPSFYWRRNFAVSFLDDRPAMILKDLIGVENLMWSTDFPHSCTFWPNSLGVAATSMKDLTAAERCLVIGGNAKRFFGIRGDV
jgi:predicted TIM-barrel fold metal-dependent hydrolase